MVSPDKPNHDANIQHPLFGVHDHILSWCHLVRKLIFIHFVFQDCLAACALRVGMRRTTGEPVSLVSECRGGSVAYEKLSLGQHTEPLVEIPQFVLFAHPSEAF